MAFLLKMIAGDFGLFVQPRFWNPPECRRLLEISQTSPAEDAGVYLEGGLKVDERFRRSERIHLTAPLRETIQQSILSIKGRVENHYGRALTGMQPFQFLRYRTGHYFRTHQDERRPVSDLTRKISIILFLNANSSGSHINFQGGEIVFYRNFEQSMAGDGYYFPAEEGLLLAFSSYLLHEVKEVTNGFRYSIVSWFF